MSEINNNNDNNGYNPNYNSQPNPEQQFSYSPDMQFVPQPADPFVQQPVQQQQQAWYNQDQNLTPQEQAWYNQPQQNGMENIVEDLEQIYIAKQLKKNTNANINNNQQNKPPQKKKRKKLTFGRIIRLLLLIAIIALVINYFSNKSFLEENVSEQILQYTVETDYMDYVTGNIYLPDTLDNQESPYRIIWESSHPDVLSTDGVVNRPSDKNTTVTLTLNIKRGLLTAKKEFNLVVIKTNAMSKDNVFVLTPEMIEEGISKNEFIITYKEDGSIHSIDGNFNNTLIESEADALVVIDAYRNLLSIDDNISFKLDKVQTSLIGKTYFFIPAKNDIHVAGQGVTISTKNNYLSTITTNVTSVSYEPDTELTETQLLEIANAYLSSTNAGILSTNKYIADNKLVYNITVYQEDNNTDLISLTIDAATQNVLSKEDVVLPYTSITGTGVDVQGNKQTFPVVKEKGALITKYKLMDASRNIIIVDSNDYTWKKMQSTQKYNAITTNDNNWDNYSVGISVLTNFMKTYDWYKEVLGYTSFDGKGQTIYCFLDAQTVFSRISGSAGYVHGVEVFLSGDKGETLYYPALAKLEVSAHEFTHGVFAHVANHMSVYGNMASSIDEGYADIFGCLVEGDWIVGDGIVIGYEAKRDPTNTIAKLPKTFPEKYFDKNWSTDGHLNSILLTRAAYQMTQKGFSENDVARIWFQSLFYGYYDGDDFLTVRNHVEQAARDLGYSDEQIVIIGDIFGAMDIGEMATRVIESYSVEGDRVKDNTTERTYIIVFSPIGTVVANTPVWIFEEDNNVSATATDAQMSEFLSQYVTQHLSSLVPEIPWNITVNYQKYSPWAMNIIGEYLDDAKQGLLNQISEESGMEEKDANVLLSMAFVAFKYKGTAYDFFSEILELDYSRLIIEEAGNIAYDFTE